MTDAPQHPVIETPDAEPAERRVSAIWLVPLLALLVSLFVAWRAYDDRGPLIEIVLDSAAGIEAGKTTVRFRDVVVGVVEQIAFTEDLRQVVASARIHKEMTRYLDSEAEFWVVRPQVSAQGVSGIETVLSGVFIEAYWDDTPGPRAERFTALTRPPLTSADQPGLRVTLRAPDGGSLAVGAPVLYKRIRVGRIEDVMLTDAGDVEVKLFVNAPYDAFLTEGARFWNASGFSFNFGAGGASLNVESVASLVQGGIGFAQIGSEIEPVREGHVFELYPSEALARQNVIEDLPGARLTLTAFFESSVSGLQPGAKVDFRGVTVGEVTAFQPVVLRGEDGPMLRMRVTLVVVPQRLGLDAQESDTRAAGLDLLGELVDRGLRARLASSGLLSQSLHVELAELEDPPPGELLRAAEPYPVIPTAPSEVSGVAASAENVMNRLASLPVEELMETFTTLLANVNALVTEDSFRAAPENLGRLIADIRETVETSGIREIPAQVSSMLASAQAVIEDARSERVVAALASALDAATETVGKIGTAADRLPPLIEEVSALSARAGALPLDEFVASATRTVDGIDALVRSEGVTAIPTSVDSALDEARALLADLRAGGAVENANATLAALRAAADEIAAADLAARVAEAVEAAERAAANVENASAGLPAVVENLRSLSERVDQLALDDLVASATTTLASADALLASEGMGRVPDELSGALAQLRLTLAELRDGGAVQNVNATLASADQAAAAITRAADELPALIGRLNAVTARADTALAGVSPGSELTREAQMTLRDLRNAAQSLNALVIALERRPNSVLFGR